jgi:ABC-2 type transport system permease protein
MDIHKLAVTGRNSGTISYQDVDMSLRSRNAFGVRRVTTREPYIIAAHVTGTPAGDAKLYLSGEQEKDSKSGDEKDAAEKKDDAKGGEAAAKDADKSKAEADDALAGKAPDKAKLNVVLVADIDWIAPIIFRLREMGEDPDSIIDFRFQNVAFVLNILDSLADDELFVDLRKRTLSHRILTNIEEATEDQRTAALVERDKFLNDARQQIEAAQNEFRKKMDDLQNRKDLPAPVLDQLVERERIRLERLRDVQIASLESKRNTEVKKSERELAAKIRGVQDRYKLLAVLLPPILPILLAFFVYFHRRKAEQEGVDTRRLRYGKPQDKAA